MNTSEIIRKSRFWRAELAYRLFFHGDENIKNLLKEQIASDYLKRKYIDPYYKTNDTVVNYSIENKVYPYCWIYWKQGIDNAPYLVKTCVESARQVFINSGWKVSIIDIETIKGLVDLPDYIWKKHDEGKISEAHFADFVRVALLNKYGGCWVDATVYFSITDHIPAFIYEEGFFAFRNVLKNDNYINISNWMIYSTPNNPLINDMQQLLSNYWEKENVFIQYYGFHIMFKQVTDHHKGYWSKLSSYSNVPPHIFQVISLQQYNENVLRNALKSSDIHKLTWHLPDDYNGTNIDCFLKRVMIAN